MNDLDFKIKYIKYKLKYLELKQNKQIGGGSIDGNPERTPTTPDNLNPLSPTPNNLISLPSTPLLDTVERPEAEPEIAGMKEFTASLDNFVNGAGSAMVIASTVKEKKVNYIVLVENSHFIPMLKNCIGKKY